MTSNKAPIGTIMNISLGGITLINILDILVRTSPSKKPVLCVGMLLPYIAIFHVQCTVGCATSCHTGRAGSSPKTGKACETNPPPEVFAACHFSHGLCIVSQRTGYDTHAFQSENPTELSLIQKRLLLNLFILVSHYVPY